MRVWDAEARECKQIIELQSDIYGDELWSVKWSSTNTIVSGGKNLIEFWEPQTGNLKLSKPITSIPESSNGSETKAASQQESRNSFFGMIISVAFLSNSLLLTSSEDCTARIWDIELSECTNILSGYRWTRRTDSNKPVCLRHSNATFGRNATHFVFSSVVPVWHRQ